jgi:hypothetical protein
MFCLGMSAQMVKEKKEAGAFSKILSSSGIDVHFTQGEACALEIEADAENMPKVEYSVTSGRLELRRKKGVNFTRNPKGRIIRAYVSAPALEGIELSGGADFESRSVSADNLDVTASGGSDIEIYQLKAADCRITASGGSDTEIKDLSVSKLEVTASGGSDADIHISSADEVRVTARGGSDVDLSGKAKTVSIKRSSGSDVNIKKLACKTIKNKR